MSEQLDQNPAPAAAAPLEYAIQTEDLWRIYIVGAHQEVPALRGINLAVESCTFVALKGRSGSGKTTLLNCLGGLDSPTRGVIRIFGQDISTLKRRTAHALAP